MGADQISGNECCQWCGRSIHTTDEAFIVSGAVACRTCHEGTTSVSETKQADLNRLAASVRRHPAPRRKVGWPKTLIALLLLGSAVVVAGVRFAPQWFRPAPSAADFDAFATRFALDFQAHEKLNFSPSSELAWSVSATLASHSLEPLSTPPYSRTGRVVLVESEFCQSKDKQIGYYSNTRLRHVLLVGHDGTRWKAIRHTVYCEEDRANSEAHRSREGLEEERAADIIDMQLLASQLTNKK